MVKKCQNPPTKNCGKKTAHPFALLVSLVSLVLLLSNFPFFTGEVEPRNTLVLMFLSSQIMKLHLSNLSHIIGNYLLSKLMYVCLTLFLVLKSLKARYSLNTSLIQFYLVFEVSVKIVSGGVLVLDNF